MKKYKIGMWLFICVTAIALVLIPVSVAYSWGYMQSAIDHNAAYFSAPAYVILFEAIPFLLIPIATALLSFLCYRKSKNTKI